MFSGAIVACGSCLQSFHHFFCLKQLLVQIHAHWWNFEGRLGLCIQLEQSPVFLYALHYKISEYVNNAASNTSYMHTRFKGQNLHCLWNGNVELLKAPVAERLGKGYGSEIGTTHLSLFGCDGSLAGLRPHVFAEARDQRPAASVPDPIFCFFQANGYHVAI